jgi:TetR/AcrR family tetracycline transcriptional repressor
LEARNVTQPLDREQITAAALELLRTGGAKNLSTRRLADKLGIKSASLYYHFKDKQQLLDYVSAAMIEPAWRKPHAGETWQEWLVAIGFALRRTFNSYGDGALIAAGSTPPAEAVRDSVALLYAPLLAAGLPQDLTRNIVVTVLRFVGGWTFDEQIALSRGAARPDKTNEEGFEFGLRAIICGSEVYAARLAQGAPE